MSRPRRGARSSTAENAIQKAHELVASTDTASIKTVWEDLCQSYRAALHNGITSEAFPYWILHNIPHEVIPKMLEAVHGRGAMSIAFYAPCLLERFDMPQWQIVLFLGSLSQPKVTTLNAITKGRPDITLDRLYRELCKIRSKSGLLPDGPSDFKLAELKSCFKPHSSGDEHESSSDVEYRDSDETSQQAISVSSDEDDFDRHSEVNGNDDFDDCDDLDNCNPCPEPRTSVRGVLGEDSVPPSQKTSPTSVPVATVDTHNARGNASGVVVPGATQLDQSHERQNDEPEAREAGGLPESEPTANSITVATIRTRVNMQDQNTGADKTFSQDFLALRSATTSLVKTIDSLEEEHEKLNHEQIDMQIRHAKTEADMDAECRSLELILQSKFNATTEQVEIAKANLSGFENLGKKRKIEESELQKQQAKWAKLKADMKELQERVLG